MNLPRLFQSRKKREAEERAAWLVVGAIVLAGVIVVAASKPSPTEELECEEEPLF